MQDVPTRIATCPECGSALSVEVTEWLADGTPTVSGIQVDCIAEDIAFEKWIDGGEKGYDPSGHRYWQCDWQPVVDAIARWLGAEGE